MTSKHCTKCKELKLLKRFNKHKRTKDGLHSTCMDCGNKSAKLYQKTKRGVIASMLARQTTTSKIKGYEKPKYSLDELENYLITETQYNCLYDEWVKSSYKKDLKPSIDRLDDYKGYFIENIQLVTWKENNEKGWQDRKNGINNKLSRAVCKLNNKGDVVERFESLALAARSIGVGVSSVWDCCNKRINKVKGYKWQYAYSNQYPLIADDDLRNEAMK